MREVLEARSELELISQIGRSFKNGGSAGRVRLGIGDDCAVLRPTRGWDVVVTTDLTMEGRHFRRDLHIAESAGHRCLARGLSDVAAMGAEPVAAFLSLGLPSAAMKTATGRRWVAGFLGGLRALAERYGVPLAGGDTGETVADGLVADIVLLGQVPAGRELRRSGARVGDGIYVTGALGGAAAELRDLMEGRLRRANGGEASGARPQSFPEPRLAVGRALRRRGGVSACIDVSDGISTDLQHLCEASSVGSEIWTATLPLHSLATPAKDALELALNGGEDYELLFTAAGAVPKKLAGVRVTRIGTVTPRRRGLCLVAPDGARVALRRGGWEHFRS